MRNFLIAFGLLLKKEGPQLLRPFFIFCLLYVDRFDRYVSDVYFVTGVDPVNDDMIVLGSDNVSIVFAFVGS